jgi:class 3 adenylate cyclase
VPATAVVIDLRNFSPNLGQAGVDDAGINEFCHFLSDFYALCLRACLVALPPDRRDTPAVHLTSTGDGIIAVFYEPGAHHRDAMLAAVVLHQVLSARCAAYNDVHTPCAPTSFGIGVESGQVNRVQAHAVDTRGVPMLDTFIGGCINIASRIESVTKTLHRARCIFGPRVNQRLVLDLHGIDFGALRRAASGSGSDTIRLAAQDQMVQLNRALCLSYLHEHRLKGVAAPQALFRLSESAMGGTGARRDGLLHALTGGAAPWRAQIEKVLQGDGLGGRPPGSAQAAR